MSFGRVALLASDHAWLWARGYDGGGPQLEMLRRLAHWMMAEPELEEEALWAEATGQRMRIVRRSLESDVGEVEITTPEGDSVSVPLQETAPGPSIEVFLFIRDFICLPFRAYMSNWLQLP